MRDEEDEPISITGLNVIAKCAAVVVHSDKPEFAADAGELAVRYLANPNDAPKGVRLQLQRLAVAIRELPPTYTPRARFRADGQERVFKLIVTRPEVILPPHEVLVLRAEPIRAGGSRPVARFEARGEGKPFTLQAADDDWDIIRMIGATLHKPCDLVAKVVRDEEGHIAGGEIVSVEIPDADSRGAWERWYQANAKNISFEADHEGADE